MNYSQFGDANHLIAPPIHGQYFSSTTERASARQTPRPLLLFTSGNSVPPLDE